MPQGGPPGLFCLGHKIRSPIGKWRSGRPGCSPLRASSGHRRLLRTIRRKKQPNSPRSRVSPAPPRPIQRRFFGSTRSAACAVINIGLIRSAGLSSNIGLDDDPPRAARAYALQNITGIDAGIACWDGKYTYWAIRPVQRDPAVKPLFPTPNHPSYPAAHGCLSTAEAAILRYLFPRAAVALDALAREAAESLVSAGIHYRSDIVAGRALGHAVAEKVIARARNDGSQ